MGCVSYFSIQKLCNFLSSNRNFPLWLHGGRWMFNEIIFILVYKLFLSTEIVISGSVSQTFFFKVFLEKDVKLIITLSYTPKMNDTVNSFRVSQHYLPRNKK